MVKNIRIIIFIYVFSFNVFFSQSIKEEKSILSPTLKSIIFPGWGQYNLNKPKRGNLFLTTEVLGIALTTFSFVKSNNAENTYIAMAAEHAGVAKNGKEHQYWVDIGNYNSREEFNDEHLRWREYDNLYPDEEIWNWEWDVEKNRKEFENLRIQSDKYELVGKFIIGGIVLNHIISAIDAFYLHNVSFKDKVEVFSYYNPESQFMQYSLIINL